MNNQDEKSLCIVLFIFSSGVTFVFFYLLFVFSYLILWIEIPTVVTLGLTIAVFLGGFGYLFIKARKKRWQRLTAISLGGITAPSLTLVLMLTFSFISAKKNPEQMSNRQQHLISSSGKYILSVPIKRIRRQLLSFGHPYWQVTISDQNGNVIYQDKEKTFPGWFETYWIWDQQDHAWLYGSDTGTYFYENINGQWIKHPWKKTSGIDPPEGLFPKYAGKYGRMEGQ